MARWGWFALLLVLPAAFAIAAPAAPCADLGTAECLDRLKDNLEQAVGFRTRFIAEVETGDFQAARTTLLRGPENKRDDLLMRSMRSLLPWRPSTSTDYSAARSLACDRFGATVPDEHILQSVSNPQVREQIYASRLAQAQMPRGRLITTWLKAGDAVAIQYSIEPTWQQGLPQAVARAQLLHKLDNRNDAIADIDRHVLPIAESLRLGLAVPRAQSTYAEAMRDRVRTLILHYRRPWDWMPGLDEYSMGAPPDETLRQLQAGALERAQAWAALDRTDVEGALEILQRIDVTGCEACRDLLGRAWHEVVLWGAENDKPRAVRTAIGHLRQLAIDGGESVFSLQSIIAALLARDHHTSAEELLPDVREALRAAVPADRYPGHIAQLASQLVNVGRTETAHDLLRREPTLLLHGWPVEALNDEALERALNLIDPAVRTQPPHDLAWGLFVRLVMQNRITEAIEMHRHVPHYNSDAAIEVAVDKFLKIQPHADLRPLLALTTRPARPALVGKVVLALARLSGIEQALAWATTLAPGDAKMHALAAVGAFLNGPDLPECP